MHRGRNLISKVIKIKAGELINSSKLLYMQGTVE